VHVRSLIGGNLTHWSGSGCLVDLTKVKLLETLNPVVKGFRTQINAIAKLRIKLMNINIPFWNNASPRRKRIYAALFVFLLSVLAIIVGFVVPVSQQDALALQNQLNQTETQGLATGTLPLSIFLNNFLLCLAMFIPLVGLPIGLFLMFNLGQGFRGQLELATSGAVSTGSPQIQASTAILFLALAGLTFLLEFTSYSIGMSESIWLFRRLTQHRWRELKTALILIGVVAVLMAIGGVVESYAVSLAA
jgi:hypothetical protein